MSIVAMAGATLTGCSKGKTTGTDSETTTESVVASETGETNATDETSATLDPSTLNTEGSLSEITLDDYITMGEYKGLAVSVAAVDITEDDVNNTIEQGIERYLTEENLLEEGTVKEGDVARIDYVGKKDDVAFDGGTASDYDLTIGSGQFIPGFEDGLIGVKVGETTKLNLTFPEEYGNEELAGQAVVFEVTVKGIVETVTPELTDENASQLATSMGIEATDVASLKKAAYDKLVETAETNREAEISYKVTKALYDSLEIKEVPEFLKNRLYVRMDSNYTYYAQAYGIDNATYFQYMYGVEPSQYSTYLMDMASEYATQYVAFQKVAELEGLTVDDEEAKKSIDEIYADFGYESAEEFLKDYELDTYRDDVMFKKVLKFLVDNAVVTDEVAEEVVLETEEITETDETVETNETETTETETTEE